MDSRHYEAPQGQSDSPEHDQEFVSLGVENVSLEQIGIEKVTKHNGSMTVCNLTART